MRIQPFAVAASAALALMFAGCATTRDLGWQGQGATPFDAAQAECRAEATASPESGREGRFTACMAGQGWSRGGTRDD